MADIAAHEATRRVDDFTDAERAAVYRAIALRRDVRAEFLPDPVDDDVLMRVLSTARQAPSVRLSQPWRFIVVRDGEKRRAACEAFDRANADAAAAYGSPDAERYRSLRLSGRQTMPEMARYSIVCAIQNLWIAARAEGLGVGWVSIIDPAAVRALLGIPASVAVVAYLCVDHVTTFAPQADLERDGWEARLPLADVIDDERYRG